MKLFSIKRYDGDSAENDPGKEDEILQKLLKKVEKRKRKLQKESKNNEPVKKNDIPDAIAALDNIQEHDSKKANLEVVQTDELSKSEDPISNDDFQVLGEEVFKKKQKVKMFLPPWLANPIIITNTISQDESITDQEIQSLEYISDQIKKNLKSMKIQKLFPVQEEVIPWVLNAYSKPTPFRPRDICVSSPTGSGKTLAFAIPIVQLLLNRVERKIRALIVLPVNELALQVFKVFKHLTDKTNLDVSLLSKSIPFTSEQNQLIEKFNNRFYSKTDIVVTTPGRLVEHLHATPGFCLKSLKFLVIDEADRIMEQIHHNWLYHLDNHVKSTTDMMLSGRSAPLCLVDLEEISIREPHKMLFSATLSQDPEKLQNLRLFQPKLFTSVVKSREELLNNISENIAEETCTNGIRGEFIGKYTTPAELSEKHCITETRLKPLTLFSLITENNWTKFLCFTNSADGAHRLCFVLQNLFNKATMKISELSSILNQEDRKDILTQFAMGKINGLICSDALSRGIDIPEVDVVISYDVPRHIKTYIHRVGRTARAGHSGTAVTMLGQGDLKTFQNILSDTGKVLGDEIKIESNLEEETAKQYMFVLNNLQKKIETEKKLKMSMKRNEKLLGVQIKNDKKLSVVDRLQTEISNIIQTENSTGKISRKHRKNLVKVEKNYLKRKHFKMNKESN